MAVLYITEYNDIAYSASSDSTNDVSAEPNVVEQTVAIGGASASSAAFNNRTRFVRLHTDAICSVKFGTAPTATATTARMAANETRLIGVPMGAAFKVAVITNT